MINKTKKTNGAVDETRRLLPTLKAFKHPQNRHLHRR